MPFVPGGLKALPVGSVIERRQDGRMYLVVQETPDKASIVESCDDALDVINRLLGRLKRTLEDMNTDMEACNERLAAGLRETGAKIVANGRLLDEIVRLEQMQRSL